VRTLGLMGIAASIVLAGCGSQAPASQPEQRTPLPSSLSSPDPGSAATFEVTIVPGSTPPEPTPDGTPSPSLPPSFEAGLMLETVADRVRMRSQPSVGQDSRMYEPVLPLGTQLQALEGPVAGNDRWWYRVVLAEPDQHLVGGVRDGWVAIADHDSTPWVGVLRDIDPAPPAPPVREGWPSVRRGSVILSGTPAEETQSGVRLAVEVHGLLPGTKIQLEADGDYEVLWRCGGGAPGEVGAGMVDAGTTVGSDSTIATLVIGEDAIGRGAFELVAVPPEAPCPSGYAEPKITWERHWRHLRVRDVHHFLELAPPQFDSADVV
jgi:hypothetical protein